MTMQKTTRKRRSKYFEPQNQDGHRQCDHPGCCEPGEYRAPKDRKLKDYYWFCLKHVQEYNARWNYYEGETGHEEEQERRRRFRFSSKIRYNFGFDFNGNFEFVDDYKPGMCDFSQMYFSEQERKYLKIMEITCEELSADNLKKQYKKLVKKYHPDLHQGDKEAEEKFKLLGTAYKALLRKIS